MSRFNLRAKLSNADSKTFQLPQGSFTGEMKYLQEHRRNIEKETIASTERSLKMLRESEQVGIATAEELVKQREQLENTDKRLDEMHATLRFSQKHISGMKSVWANFKNIMAKKCDCCHNCCTRKVSMKANAELKKNLASYETKPSTKMNQTEFKGHTPSVFDANLQEMSAALARLKELSANLTTEIDNQNELIDRLNTKTDKVDCAMTTQTKDMSKLLKK